MVFITIDEIIDIIIMVFAIGYIFSGFIKRKPTEGYDPLKYFQQNQLWEDIKFGAMVAAPAVVLHELAHKFVAMGFGAQATLHAPITMYLIVILMKMLKFPVLFFVGGYVTHTALPAFESAMVAIAGPLMNLAVYIISMAVIKYKLVDRKYYRAVGIAGKLNLFLLIFNMLPIPGFDGFHFFANIGKVIGLW